MTPFARYEARVREGQIGAWGTTLIVEGITAALLARFFGLAPSRAARAAIAGSLTTHPFVWWAYFQLIPHYGYWTTLALIECIAVFGEAPFYRLAGAPWHRALLISLIVNASSVLVGLLVL
ncbi:MAG: hypothetical protein QM698_11845 [Micropepsaceae bacterium]